MFKKLNSLNKKRLRKLVIKIKKNKNELILHIYLDYFILELVLCIY
jgi:hypothetical protein